LIENLQKVDEFSLSNFGKIGTHRIAENIRQSIFGILSLFISDQKINLLQFRRASKQLFHQHLPHEPRPAAYQNYPIVEKRSNSIFIIRHPVPPVSNVQFYKLKWKDNLQNVDSSFADLGSINSFFMIPFKSAITSIAQRCSLFFLSRFFTFDHAR
jgi:hypothetical protein